MNAIRYRWNIVKENPLFWLNILFALISALFIKHPGSTDFWIRLWGLFLQLTGIVTVWMNLVGTARLFNRGSWPLIRNTFTWFRRLVGSREINSISANLKMPSFQLRGRATQRRSLKGDESIEDRVKILEENFNYLNSDLEALYSELHKTSDSLHSKINKEHEQLKDRISSLKSTLEKTAIGNFSMMVFGVVWLAIGVVVATLAQEIHRLLTGGLPAIWSAAC